MIFKKNDTKSKPALEEIYEEIEQKQNGRDQLLIDLAAKMNECKEAERKATELIFGSTDVNDVELIETAALAQDKAAFRADFYKRSLDRARKAQLFEEERRRELASFIQAEVESIRGAKFARATELLEEAMAEIEVARVAAIEANKYIDILNRNATTIIGDVDIYTVSCVLRNLRAVLNSNPAMTQVRHDN